MIERPMNPHYRGNILGPTGRGFWLSLPPIGVQKRVHVDSASLHHGRAVQPLSPWEYCLNCVLVSGGGNCLMKGCSPVAHDTRRGRDVFEGKIQLIWGVGVDISGWKSGHEPKPKNACAQS